MPETSQHIKEEVIQKVDLIEEYSIKFITWAKEFFPHLIFAILTLIVGLWLIKRIAKISVAAMERRHVDVSLRTFFKSLIGIGLKVILFIMVAGMLGIQTASFVAILGAAGLAVGLALQGSLSNFAGGVLILILKPYRVGDSIEALGQKGEVKEIQIFNTILLAGDHRTIILPNGAVSNAFIINHSKHGNLRVDIDVKVSDTHHITQVREIILSLLAQDERILKKPAPSVAISQFVDKGYEVAIRFFCETSERAHVHDETVEKINDAFAQRGIESPKPHTLVKNIS